MQHECSSVTGCERCNDLSPCQSTKIRPDGMAELFHTDVLCVCHILLHYQKLPNGAMYQHQILCEAGENPPLKHATCYRQLMGIMLCCEHKHLWFTHFHKNRGDNGWQKNGLQFRTVEQSAQFIARDHQVTQCW